jgi:predicted membrane channel-forming protein YqfA (hemolysin III family)
VRVLIEVVHIAIGLIAAALIAWAAAWSYPRATGDIWLVTFVAMGLVVLMGIGPIRRAYAVDRATLDRHSRDNANV